jgi:hypothetical protein
MTNVGGLGYWKLEDVDVGLPLLLDNLFSNTLTHVRAFCFWSDLAYDQRTFSGIDAEPVFDQSI